MMPIIIGIAGGTGSGKTTLTKHLVSRFADKVSVVYHDNYYKRNDHLTYEERCKINYDSPDAFDTGLMLEHLRQLKKGKSVSCPVYDYSIHNRSDKTLLIESRQVIIVEGILVFQNEALRGLMDIKIFVDTDADERIMRRIQRDVCERGRAIESVISQYRSTVKPMHEKYVEPSKRYADIIVVGGGENIVALQMLSTRIEKWLSDALTLSPMTKEDIKEIALIEKECFSSPWSEKGIGQELENENAVFFTAKKEGALIGYMGMHTVLDECYIANIAVKGEHRRRGVGRALLLYAVKRAEERGCRFISLEVRKSNSAARELYLSEGFTLCGERRGFYTEPAEDALIMTKELK